MYLTPAPPRESLRPKRKQNFYDFANQVFEYGEELAAYKDSEDFQNDSLEDQEAINKELVLLKELNEFQVNQIILSY